ncbi:MAG: hypothetical protein R2909_09700 [Gemmatimonadales bacterium]
MLVAELLGSRADPRRIRDIVRGLSWRVRFGSARVLGIAVGAAVALVVGVMLAAPRLLPEPPVVRVAAWHRDPDGGYRLFARGVGSVDVAGEPLAVDGLEPTELRSADRPSGVVRPGGWDALVTTRTFADSGGEDVLLVAKGATPMRLTSLPGDDVVGDWSPDGEYLVIQTDRWSGRSMSDLAILDPQHADSIVRRLTAEPDARDVWPLWSPDGTRIAFVRTPLEVAAGDPPHSVCVVSSDGSEESCLTVQGYEGLHLVGWANPVELVGLYSDRAGSIRLVVVSTLGGSAHELAEAASIPFQSRAQGWTACYCRRDPGEPYQSLVFPVAHPEQALRLLPSDPPPELELLPAREDRSYLDRLAITGVDRPVPADVAYQLRLSGWDPAGRPVQPLGVRWRTSDTSVAVVSAAGILQARRAGTVTVWATAGGWRTDSAAITIVPPRVRAEVSERWTSDFEERWVPFGEPRPHLVETARGHALVPNGDSTFTSGVYLRRALPTEDGIGVDFSFSAPITSRSWQYLDVKLVAADQGVFDLWDHRTGGLPIGDYQWRSCGIYYPHGARRDQLHLQGGLTRPVDIAPEAERGAWVGVRLKLFPDGRCGVAVDGRPLAILPRRIPLGDSVRLVIDAYSHRTRILVGPMTVWTGVRRDIDWSGVEGAGPDGR